MRSTRTLSVILAVVMLLSLVLTSCTAPEETTAEANSTQSTEVTTNDNTEATTEPTAEKTEQSLPEQTTEGTVTKAPSTDTESESESESDSDSVTESESESTETEPTTDISNEETTEETTMEAEIITTEETTEETTVITDSMIGDVFEAEYAADFSVSRVFSNDMIVQRGEHIRVWGFAPESENGKKVTGEFKGMLAEALIENGEWCLTFTSRLEADTVGAEMKIYAGENKTVTFTGVLVGDVYIVVGQSNVEYSVQNHINNTNAATHGGGAAAIDENSIIRLNKINNSSGGYFDKKGTGYVYKDAQNTKQWTKTTQSDTLGFSAIGYYFAKKVVEKTNGEIPVGVIEFGFSGAPLGSYLPNEIAEKHNTDTLSPINGTYTTTGVNAGSSPGRWIYNCHMAAFEKFAMAGLIWYQGESNNTYDEAVKYNEIFASLVEYMRDTHNVINKDFPVFVTEFPSIYKKPEGSTETWHFMELGIIRSFMGSIPTVIDNSYVSVSSDLWSNKTFFNSLHPNCKFEQAERLAALANAVVYGNGTLDTATGPIFKDMTLSADKKTVILSFTNVGEGLTTKDGGKAVQGIVGFGAKTIGLLTYITPQSAEITAKGQITVTFDEEVKGVAYNFLSSDLYGETLNLCNSAKCPASAFVTPYEEIDLGHFEAKDFLDRNHKALGLVGKAFDTLTADEVNLFEVGGIESKLNAVGNKVEIIKGTNKISCYGWVGFKHKIMVMGYSIDGSNAILNTTPSAPADAVLAAGGQNAVRFTISVDVSGLEIGDHTVSLLALVDYKNGTVAKLLTFTVTVTEPVEKPDVPTVDPDTPDSSYPPYNSPEYGLKGFAFDLLTKDGTNIYPIGSIATKLEADGNRITVAKGTKTIRMFGWIGFETALDKFGWAIDGKEVIATEPSPNPNSDIISSGGEHARRFDVFADVSSLEVGEHTLELLVRINTKDGKTVTLLIHSITVNVTE